MLTDGYGRSFEYLRLSVTDVCNFRCGYCLPSGYQRCDRAEPLTRVEIRRAVAAFAALGVRKIRLTGGEPTLRTDLPSIIGDIKSIDPSLTVALTTNGFRLERLLPAFQAAGLDALNVSLDSLSPHVFKTICGRDEGDRVRRAIERAQESGRLKVKVNTVLLKGLNDTELPVMADWIRSRAISVRWIELMRTSDNHDYFGRHFLSNETLQRRALEAGWSPVPRTAVDGPATEWVHSDFVGRIGFISPYARDFCRSCNRLRVSSLGGLRLCLFGAGDLDLRPFLGSDSERDRLLEFIVRGLRLKPVSHGLHRNQTGDMGSLSAIGG